MHGEKSLRAFLLEKFTQVVFGDKKRACFHGWDMLNCGKSEEAQGKGGRAP